MWMIPISHVIITTTETTATTTLWSSSKTHRGITYATNTFQSIFSRDKILDANEEKNCRERCQLSCDS